MRCIECEEIELARVRDQRPAQTLPIPYAALDGFPAGRTPSRPDAPPAAAVGRRRLRVGLRRQGAGLEQVWESVAAAAEAPRRSKCLVLLYLAGGNDGLNVDPAERRRGLRGVRRPRGRTSTAARRAERRRRPTGVGSRPLPGPGGAALAFANVTVSKPAAATTATLRTAATTASTRSTATAPAALGSDLAVMPAVDAKKYSLSHFDNSRHLVRGEHRPEQQDRLARPLDRPQRRRDTTRCRRSRSTPRCRSRSARR